MSKHYTATLTNHGIIITTLYLPSLNISCLLQVDSSLSKKISDGSLSGDEREGWFEDLCRLGMGVGSGDKGESWCEDHLRLGSGGGSGDIESDSDRRNFLAAGYSSSEDSN